MKCRVCGCTDDRPCENGCYWVEARLCSVCRATEAEAAEAVLAAAPPWRPTEDDLAEIADRLTDGMCLERWGSRLVRETVAGQLLQQLATLGYLRRPPAPDSGNAEGSA